MPPCICVCLAVPRIDICSNGLLYAFLCVCLAARDIDGQTPCYVAAQNGHTDCLEALLEQGVDPEAARDDGCTPL